MIEKNMQSLFKVWLGQNMPKKTSVYELKMEKGKSIAFDRVYDHQITGLRQAKYAGMYHKIADTTVPFGGGIQRFNKPKPFDCMVITQADAYVVIMFYQPREDKICYFIDIDDFIKEKENSSRKSLTEERAREISKLIKII
jgi:hypothetical protein